MGMAFDFRDVWNVRIQTTGRPNGRSDRRDQSHFIIGSSPWSRIRLPGLPYGDPAFIAVFWGASTAIAGSTRFALRTWLRRLRVQGRDSRNILIIGSNQRAIAFAKRIRAKPELGYRLIGFADDEWSGAEALRQEGWSLVCNLENISTFLRRSVVDEVIIAGSLCQQHGRGSLAEAYRPG